MTRWPRRRRYLMCPPTHFDVTYSINPWMDPTKPVDPALAMVQWDRLRMVHESLGHVVEQISPVAGLPDMVYSANGAVVHGRRALVARFRDTERAAEARQYTRWFRCRGWTQRRAKFVSEGEGDFLFAGRYILAATGFRSGLASHRETQEFFRRPVIGLTLVDPRFYHLDTALTVLDGEEIAYYPPAFSPGSRAVLRRLFPDALIATEDDALAFGLNAVSDGRNVVLSQTATGLIEQLRERGYRPIDVDLSELFKGGGGAKCCTLVLHDTED